MFNHKHAPAKIFEVENANKCVCVYMYHMHVHMYRYADILTYVLHSDIDAHQ